MDKDSRLIFENYAKNQILNESVRGLWDALANFFSSGGGRATVRFTHSGLAEVKSALKSLQDEVTAINNSFTGETNIIGPAANALERKVNDLLRIMASNTNNRDFLGLLESIVVNYNQTLANLKTLSTAGLDSKTIREAVKTTAEGYDDVIALVLKINSPLANRMGYKTQLIKHLTELKQKVKYAEEFAKEQQIDKRGVGLLIVDWMKFHWIISTFIGVGVAAMMFTGEAVGGFIFDFFNGIVNVCKVILNKFDFLGVVKGFKKRAEEEYGDEAAAAAAALKGQSNNNWPQINPSGQSAVQQGATNSPTPAQDYKLKAGDLNYDDEG